jgi:hypothetical protein
MNNYASETNTTEFIRTHITKFLECRKRNSGYKKELPQLRQLYDVLHNKRSLKNISAVKLVNENLLTVNDGGFLFVVYLTTSSYSVYLHKTKKADFYDNEYFNYLRSVGYVIKERSFTDKLKKIYVQSCASDDNKIFIKNNNTYYELNKSIII